MENNIYLGGLAVADVKITATNNIASLATDRGINQDGNMDGLNGCVAPASNGLPGEVGLSRHNRSGRGLRTCPWDSRQFAAYSVWYDFLERER